MDADTDCRQKQILLVEDSDADVCLFRMAAREVMPGVAILRVKDCAQALRLLRTDAPVPSLILLDVNLPDGSGLDVLAFIQADERLSAIPVVVWSGSHQAGEWRRGYELGARYCFRKGTGMTELFACAGAVASLVSSAPPGRNALAAG